MNNININNIPIGTNEEVTVSMGKLCKFDD